MLNPTIQSDCNGILIIRSLFENVESGVIINFEFTRDVPSRTLLKVPISCVFTFHPDNPSVLNWSIARSSVRDHEM